MIWFGGGSSGGNGASGSWGFGFWDYVWYLWTFPLISIGGTDESWDGQ
jgi:hypothetical protein